MVDRVSRAVGLRGSTSETSKAKPAAKPTQTASTAKPGAIRPQPKPSAPQETQEANANPTPAAAASLLSGAQPTVPSGNFEGRFGAWR
jgi:hypothetical protein